MEFTELADYPFPPGILTEWTPRTVTSPAHWPADERPVSGIHEAHVNHAELRQVTGGDEPTWLGTSFRVRGRLDRQAWACALDHWIDRHEVLRTHVAKERQTIVRRTAERGGVRISSEDIGYLESSMSVFAHLQHLLDRSTNTLVWPAYLFATIECAGHFTVVFAADHALLDGYSIALTAHELQTIYLSVTEGSLPVLPEAGSYIDFGVAERDLLENLDESHTAVQTWREFYDNDEVPLFPALPEPIAGLRIPQQSVSAWFLSSSGADRFAEASRRSNQGFLAAILACAAKVTGDLTDASEFRVIVPQHTRTEVRWAAALGWFIGLVPVRIPISATASVSDLTELAGNEMRRVRPAAALPYSRVCELIGCPQDLPFVLSYMDIRYVPGAEQWPSWQARGLRSRDHSSNEVYIWLIRTPEGLNVAIRHPGDSRTTRHIHQFAGRLRHEMEKFAVRGEVTAPSSTDSAYRVEGQALVPQERETA
ncbi:hypothetical protein ABH922_002586 [Rhodococcus sp. 27YEA15]|uniref:condensation domain-containing protein n=1 Tax=Rhodococcus sp. 27YEA15 TaxID=3156259 RepID=UPI003C7A0BF4